MPTIKKRDNTPRAACCVCGNPIGHVIPWTEVTVTGDLMRWHPACLQVMKRREAS
jgi:hypothetical protein